jgi:hypothetical protein
MAFSNDTILPSYTESKTASQDHAGAQTTFLALIAAAMAVATSAGLFTVTVAEGSATSGDIQTAISALRQLGYNVTTSVANMIITWTA